MKRQGITVKGVDKRERILSKALLLFNKHGVEQVGVREIARALGMRPGHVTYYFPDKDALVLELSERLRARNDLVAIDGTVHTVAELLARFERMLRNHIAFQGLLLSMARTLSAMPRVRARYRATQEKRLAGLRACYCALASAGELRPLGLEEVEFLVSCSSLISRGWIAEALAAGYKPEERVAHYTGLLKRLIDPYRR